MAEVKKAAPKATTTARSTAPKSGAAKPAAAASATPAKAPTKTTEEFEMTMPEMTQVPAFVQEMAEKGIFQAKDAYEKFRVAAEEATDVLEDSYENARQTTIGINLKAIESAKENSDAAFSFMTRMVGVKSLAEAIELQSGFVSKQVEVFGSQVKDMQELVAGAMTEASDPFREMFEKTLKDIKVA